MNKAMIGREYGPTTYEIGREKVKEFLKAVGDQNPAYQDGRMAPPMFAVVYPKECVSLMVFDPELDINLAMMVHGEQEFEFFDPVYSGDVITTTGKIADGVTKERPGKPPVTFVTFETTSKNQKGKLVLKAKWTMAIRGG